MPATTPDRLLLSAAVRLVYAAFITLGTLAGVYLVLLRFPAEGLNEVAVASITILGFLLVRTASRVRAA